MQASRNSCDWWLSYWVTHAVDQSNSTSNSTSDQSAFSIYLRLNKLPDASLPLADLNKSERSDWLTGGAYTDEIILMDFYYRSTASVNVLMNDLNNDNNNNSNNNNNFDENNNNIKFYMTVYAILAATSAIATIFRALLFAYGGIEAARVMHNQLIDSVFKASIMFFDTTPMGRLINRFSSDVFSIDDSLPFIFNIFLAQLFGIFGSIAICCYGLPFSAILILALSVVYYFIQRYYRHTSRELKRVTCVTQSPVYARFSETLIGLAVIRAHRQAKRFHLEFIRCLDLNQRAQFASRTIAQWLNIRFQMIGVALIAGVSILAVLQNQFGSVDPALVGLAISYVLSITNLLGGLILSFTETEKMMISVERLDEYIKDIPMEEEAGLNYANEIPPDWPTVGVVKFTDVTVKYRPHLPPAIKNVSFETRPGERIGVIGRTGSGKSSLFLALMRLVPLNSGAIFVDGVDCSALDLRKFRSKIAVIPQEPFLFGGTIRENLDLDSLQSDETIERSLAKCNMADVVARLGGLGFIVEERGQQFSVGQRQLLCLARTLLADTQILCIDEATANVDIATDNLIQRTIKEQFHGKTVLTIAHRLSTIMDSDRILVMCGGQLVEFDDPTYLLNDPNSMFSKLVKANSGSSAPDNDIVQL
ncbi:hypothetical protein HELRODRAFT_194351 [Helobdella robusta]|uniref:Uncharacterized protein n=1 Tax=Helobdella robusta TaxID=6412 RepID=T1FVZ0_HELRO|nr:hypothetical protein HELRODRAFT_194351 [Helobdella robusta]ESN92206.1 hypothetical protein HELRODRAFT_194351 [Helobdella robusta]